MSKFRLLFAAPVLAALAFSGAAFAQHFITIFGLVKLYSECPRTERPVWQTGRFYVRFQMSESQSTERPNFERSVD